ncbi:MAG: glycosyl hydrolase [Bacteroidales bacterium]|nr:glycosyl hydrolase [Bacteroidales bacterium]
MNIKHLFYCLLSTLLFAACQPAVENPEQGFLNPPDSARPGVYWYFMDGNVSKASITKDLEAMKQAGIGYVVYLEVNVGVPRGKVDFLSEEWQNLFGHAVRECERLGIFITLGTGPGWCGSGGPWVTGAQSMQHLVYSATEVNGGGTQTIRLPQPAPRMPFFGEGTLTPELKAQWETFYEDVAVLAFPSGGALLGNTRTPGQDYAYVNMKEIDEKALYYRRPYSSADSVRQYLSMSYEPQTGDRAIEKNRIIDLSAQLQADGSLTWNVPQGKWTVMRFGSRNNGAITRPAPHPGLGFEADKFDTVAMKAHLDQFTGKLFRHINFTKANPKGGLQMLHIDSWEMGAQNWTPRFREEFTRRRGYDPLPYYPLYAGVMVQSREESERFLWDLRQTAQELVLEYHSGYVVKYAKRYGLGVSVEPYDMTPLADLELAASCDMPMCEFWSTGGYNTSFSPGEGASVAHLLGQPVVPAEAFTAHLDGWKQHPGSMKNQGEWAFAAGINRFVYHTFQHQALADSLRPGMTMGPYGVHWDRNQTWWPMSHAYHRYVARCQYLLQQGRTVADILYLAPEAAPFAFRAPRSAYAGSAFLPDRKGYNFDACPPGMLYKAEVKNNRIVFPGGATYRILALPCFKTMTPALLEKITELVRDGATVVGLPPEKSPSLSNYPACDDALKALVRELWGDEETPQTLTVRNFGNGKIIWGQELQNRADNLYPHYDITARILADQTPEDFHTEGSIRYTHRTLDGTDIYLVSNRSGQQVSERCAFRITGKNPELWHPVTGQIRTLPDYAEQGGQTIIPLTFDVDEGYFIVFRNKAGTPDGKTNFPAKEVLFSLTAPWTVSFDPKWGGPPSVVFEQLTDWSENENTGIKYYSGTAFYRTRFDCPHAGNTLCLDLGAVKNMARVKLNGVDLGVVWTPPLQVDITKAVKPDGNELEIETVNLWPNRLIGDEQLSGDNAPRYTFATFKHYSKESPLLPSGLLGPVTVVGLR